MVDWQLTYRCNENCVSCIISENLYGKGVPDKYTEAIFEYIDEDTITIGGGEPTLHEDFFRMIGEAREKNPGSHIFLITNARMFSDREFAGKLADMDLGDFKVGVTLYGHEPGLHDRITRTEGSFRDTVEGVKNLLEEGLDVEVRVVVHAMNYRSLPEIQDFVAEDLEDVNSLVFMNAKYTGKAADNSEKLFVTYEEVKPYVEEAVDRYAETSARFPLKLFHFPLCTIDEKYWSHVRSGTKDSGSGEIGWADECGECPVRESCPGIWKSYLNLAGEREFEPPEGPGDGYR